MLVPVGEGKNKEQERTLCSNLSLNGRELKSSSASAMLGICFSDAENALFMDLKTAHVS